MYLTPTDNHYIVDIETDGLDAQKIWCIVVQNAVTNEVWKWTANDDLSSFCAFVQARPEAVWVGHNIVSFDGPVIERLLGVSISPMVDTLVLSYLYHPHMPGGHSLEAWGERFKFPKIEFNDWEKFSPEMLTYCVQDVALTCLLFNRLTERMRNRGFTEFSAEIEHGSRRIADVQQRNGFYFDVRSARDLYDSLRQMERDAEGRIHKVFPPRLKAVGEYKYRLKRDGTPFASFFRHKDKYPKIEFNSSGTRYKVYDWEHFNIGSPAQRVSRLLEMGWEPTTFTPKGNPKVDEDALVAWALETNVPEVQLIADWLVFNGRANMINTWLGCADEDQLIHGRLFTCGAGTRRMRHQTPNTANIPGSGARFGSECRQLWMARPGRKLCGVDAKGLEGRIFAHYLNSTEGAKFFLEGDPHQSNADAISKALGREITRGETKNLFYARLYGATNTKLGLMVGGKPKDGQLIRDAIDGNIPGFEELVKMVEQSYKENNGWLECIDGGWVRCPSPHAALNYTFQSAGAIVMKLASIILDETAEHLDYLKVGDIHDEWQFDVAETDAEELAQLACDAMTEAGKRLECRVKLEGDYKIGTNWAETH